MTYTFTVFGKPQGKGRPRLGKNGVYTPQKTRDYEEQIRWAFRRDNRGAVPFAGSVKIAAICYYSAPKQITKKRLDEIRSGIVYPTVKPDLDNVLKVVADALNGLAYVDDKQICGAYIEKRFDFEGKPRICVEVKEV